MKHLTSLLLGILLLSIIACSTTESPAPIIQDKTPEIDSTAIKARIQREQDSTIAAFYIQQHLDRIIENAGGPLRGVEIYSDAMMPELYQRQWHQFLWADTAKRSNAIRSLEAAYQDGLEPETYHIEAIQALLELDSLDMDTRAALDIMITDGIILYGTHLLNGKTDANTLVPTMEMDPRVLGDETLEHFRSLLVKGRVDSIIRSLRPQSHYYHHMMNGLAHYEQIADSGGWKVVSISQRKLEPGNEYAEIPAIRERLRIEGDYLDLPSNVNDSLVPEDLYDPTLQRAVERFQLRHGLNPDGVIGRGTVQAMNISPEEKMGLLKMNLERARWIHHDLDTNYVLVNIAGFDLRLVLGDTLCWNTKVMVGTKETSTPVFKDEMQYIEVNPTWTVPFSISNGEILPKLKKDVTYLTRNNMQLLDMSGRPLPTSGIDYNDYNEKMPYIVRQGPGNGNSLGRIKFLFPNKFRVYLHDTPSKALFARESRAFSHGCIRVENPFKLAEYILKDQGVTPAELDSVKQTMKTKRYDLEKPLPVIITYSTAFADQDLVYFYEDVYGRDKALKKALGL
jgi:murein L,D-transpeptidase YcbB/YkuD